MVRMGIIGAGRNAQGNARHFAAMSERCQVVAVADPVEEAAKTLADEFGAKAYSNFEDFLGEVDAVVISSPNHLHTEQAIACANAGKHIFCEKPMALSHADAQRMVEAADANGVKTFVAFSVRFNGVKQTMQRMLAEQKLGDVRGAWSRRLALFKGPTLNSWRADIAKSGGVILELIIHEIDWIVALLGFPKSVFCRKTSRLQEDPRDNDHVWMTFNYDNDQTATIEGSQMSPMPDYYNGIWGTDATLFTNKWGNELYYQPAGDKEPTPLELDEGLDKHAHFIDVVEGKTESVADFHYAAKVTHLIDQCLASAIDQDIKTL